MPQTQFQTHPQPRRAAAITTSSLSPARLASLSVIAALTTLTGCQQVKSKGLSPTNVPASVATKDMPAPAFVSGVARRPDGLPLSSTTPAGTDANGNPLPDASLTGAPTQGLSEEALDGFAIDAMIGHVAGQPLYASQILELEDGTLRSIAAQTRDTQQFRRLATTGLVGRLNEYLIRTLAVNEARSTLTNQEKQMMDYFVVRQKEELIRRFGEGSYTLAETNCLAITGFTLSEYLKQREEARLIDSFLKKKLDPLINVTRRNIQRYYNEHPELFNPDPQWVLRHIRVTSEQDAKQILARLENGETFADIASEPINQLNAFDQGLWDGGNPIGKNYFRFAELNDTYAELKQGQWAGPMAESFNGTTRYWFVYIEDRRGGASRTLAEAQADIYRILQDEQKRLLQGKLNKRLFERANLTDEVRIAMASDIIEVAVARYLK